MHKTTVIDNRCTLKTHFGKDQTNQSFPRKSCRYIIACIPVAVILLISTSYQKNPDNITLKGTYYPPEIRNLVSVYLQSDHAIISDSSGSQRAELINSIYASNHYAPLWTFHGVDEKGKELINLIEHAREYGLEPENYDIIGIKERISQINTKAINKKAPPFDPELDVLLTNAAFKLMINLHAGYRNDSGLYHESWLKDLPSVLLKGIYTEDLYETILSVEPKFVDYQNLRKATQNYVSTTDLNDNVTDIKYPDKDTVLLKQEIKEALMSLGYISVNGSEDFQKALKNFQQYHGLNADGKPGANTVEALKKSTLYRYRLLALNLDRLRKKDPADTSMLFVNVPAYRLKIFDGKRMTDTFRVIVGNPSTPTPLIAGDLKLIIANPVWYVPKKIAVNEILPKIKEDSTYLTRNGFKVLDKNYKQVNASEINLNDAQNFDFTFRQNRGLDNSLGQVKFIFSNPYAVYLHDTPGKQMFQKDIRAFSHGCIRVEHPQELASYILTLMKSDTAGFKMAIKKGQQREYQVTMPLKVKIMYITCEADENGQIYFYKDIYGLDNKELAMLGI